MALSGSSSPREVGLKRSLRMVKRVKGLLNRRPRKPLGYVTPTEAFFGKTFGETLAYRG